MSLIERSVWICEDHGPGDPTERKWLTGDGVCSCGRRMVEYVRADQHRGAVEALKSIAFSDHDHPSPSAADLRQRAFQAWKAATAEGGQSE